MRRWARILAACAIMATAALAGCGKETAPLPMPLPDEVSYAAIGHYCSMPLADHDGPKGQIHLASQVEPVWFSSVRDTIAFTRLPEEPRDITAIYVNDMGRVKSWEHPEPGTWVDARKAWFVIDSDRRGGMGAPEAIPFSDKSAADAFRTLHNGRVLRLADIPDSYVLGPVDLAASAPPATPVPTTPAPDTSAPAAGPVHH